MMTPDESDNETQDPLPFIIDLNKTGLVGFVQFIPTLSPNSQKLLLYWPCTIPGNNSKQQMIQRNNHISQR